ncbi:MAG: 3,4-dihydroxy-2-butanone-4-phosphate synthase [Legionellales bacterium]|nr:3,4-dihydroxy-2-butanone-4-phosphate synthase [Legionellales bacterium]
MSNIEIAIAQLQAGNMIIVTDDQNRENEGDLVFAASLTTPELINFMCIHGRGLICLSITEARAQQLGLTLQTRPNDTAHHGTAFTESIDARFGITTGISAADRAQTIIAATNANACPTDVVVPGHIFPLIANPGGVHARRGHTEASIDLMKLAELEPSAVICEIMADDGTMLRGNDLQAFAKLHDLPIITMDDITGAIDKPVAANAIPSCHIASEATLHTKHGPFTIMSFFGPDCTTENLALIKGDITTAANPLIRMHSACVTGEVFHSQHCDCDSQLDYAMAAIAKEATGIVVYLPQEGRGIGITNKIRAYQQQAQGLDTVDANLALDLPIDCRDYRAAIAFLRHHGITDCRLLTNNPTKLTALQSALPGTVTRVTIDMSKQVSCDHYLTTKKSKLNHLLEEA